MKQVQTGIVLSVHIRIEQDKIHVKILEFFNVTNVLVLVPFG